MCTKSQILCNYVILFYNIYNARAEQWELELGTLITARIVKSRR